MNDAAAHPFSRRQGYAAVLNRTSARGFDTVIFADSHSALNFMDTIKRHGHPDEMSRR
jgi:hypothetical protein